MTTFRACVMGAIVSASVACGGAPDADDGAVEVGSIHDAVRAGWNAPNMFEYVVPIELAGSGRCSGLMVTSRLMITAGHCVDGRQPSDIIVGKARGLGFYRSPHPAGSGGDIAVVRLDRHHVTPSTSIVLDEPLFDPDEVVMVAGFGKESTSDEDLSNRTVGHALVTGMGTMPKFPNAPQALLYRPGSSNQMGCGGDSGGALFGKSIDGSHVLGGIHVAGGGPTTACDDRTFGIGVVFEKNARWLYSVFERTPNPPPLLRLDSVRIRDGFVEIKYWKNVDTCATLLPLKKDFRTQDADTVCARGEQLSRQPLSTFRNIQVGKQVRLCSTENCSRPRRITE